MYVSAFVITEVFSYYWKSQADIKRKGPSWRQSLLGNTHKNLSHTVYTQVTVDKLVEMPDFEGYVRMLL